MLAFPNCKINLGLAILQKRSDGYHNLATVFYPVPLTDALEIITAPAALSPSLLSYGLSIPGDVSSNLCMKAWQLLKADYPQLPAVTIHLLKKIPMGAGLGGGSADGAFMLQLLNRKFQLAIPTGRLKEYALQLGSDCPFFLLNRAAFATSRGEVLEPLDLQLNGYQLVLVNPGIHVPTGWAFGQIRPGGAGRAQSVLETVALPVNRWKEQLVNDFEKPVFEQYPEIKLLKDTLYRMGAIYAAMTGSGSTVFGLFEPSVNLTSGLPAGSIRLQM